MIGPRRTKSETGSSSQAGGRRPGFTLLELMVVIAIIIVLVLMVVPATDRVRLAANRAKSASNLNQLGLALVNYTLDHRYNFPEDSSTATQQNAWIKAMLPYYGNDDKVRICPQDPKGPERLAAGGTSYVFNDFLTTAAGQMGVKQSTALPQPGRTVTFFIIAHTRGTSWTEDHVHATRWSNGGWNLFLADVQPDQFGGTGTDRTSGTSLYLYADRHVETILASDMKDMLDRGKNPASPWQ